MMREEWEEIKKDFERRNQNDSHGCDGCGCTCCDALEKLIPFVEEVLDSR